MKTRRRLISASNHLIRNNLVRRIFFCLFLIIFFHLRLFFSSKTIESSKKNVFLYENIENDRLATTKFVSNKLRRHSVSSMTEWTENFDLDGEKRVKFENRRYKIIKVFGFEWVFWEFSFLLNVFLFLNENSIVNFSIFV